MKVATKTTTPLLSSIFNTDNDKKDQSKNDSNLSSLFSASSKLPKRPNISVPTEEVVPSDDTKKRTDKSKTSQVENSHQSKETKSKIVKGGKKRVREKKRQLEQQQKTNETTTTATATAPKITNKNNDTGSKDKVETDADNNKKTKNDELGDKKQESNESSTTTTTTQKKTQTPSSSSTSLSKPKNQKDQVDRTVFVGNLPVDISRKELASIFKKCGKVESTRLRSVAATSVKLPPQKKGNQNLMRKVCANTNQVDHSSKKTAQGYVVFTSKESVPKALQMNNTLVSLNNDNNYDNNSSMIRLRVDTAEPTIDSTRSVFVGNLPYDADENQLHLHFSNACGGGGGGGGASSSTNDTSNNNTNNNGPESIDNVVEGVRIIRDPTTMQCKGFGYVLFKNRELVVEGLRLHESRFMNRTIRVQICGKRYKGKRGKSEADAGDADAGGTKSKSKFEGLRSTEAAAKRILGKSKDNKKGGKDSGGKLLSNGKKRRTYSERNAANFVAAKKKKTGSGVSRRAATESKIDKRVKKLQKRLSKGMGKTKR